MNDFLKRNFQIVAIGLVVVVIVLWWLVIHFIYDNPTNVFNAMLSNSLSTTGVIETLHEEADGDVINQTSLLQLGAQNRVEVYKSDIATNGSSLIKTTLIGTPSTDYSKFNFIQNDETDNSGQVPNYSSVLGVWAVEDSGTSTGGTSLRDAFQNAILIGDLNAAQKSSLLNYISVNDVYEISGVEKVSTNHRTQYVYNVNFALQPYTVALDSFGKDIGYQAISDSNSQGVYGETLKLKITVDALSRQLVSIAYQSAQVQETFTSFGIHSNINTPSHTISANQADSLIETALKK